MKTDIYQDVTDQIIQQMESLEGDWTAPFAGGLPINACTGNNYNGINTVILSTTNRFESREWGSYKQWQKRGAQVEKGEKGTPIVFFQMFEDEKTEKKFPMLQRSTVFNADQVKGYDAPAANQIDSTKVLDLVDDYVKNTGAVIKVGSSAFYSPSPDQITMPPRSAFREKNATENYYSVLLHELTHWTGHKSRLNRFKDKSKHGYAFEELIAELGAAFQCAELGIDTKPRKDHAHYLKGWLAALKNDKKFIFQAAARAQAAVNLIKSLQE